MKRIEAGWRQYAERVVPTHAPPEQMQETRRAYYAGAAALYNTVLNMLDPGDEPTDNDMDRMRELDDELKEFVADVEAGRA